MGVIVKRAINGISINGTEYLLNNCGNKIIFNDVQEATSFLLKNGLSEQLIEEFVFEEE